MPPRSSLRILLTATLSTALVVPVGTAGADPAGEGPALNWGPCPVGSGAEAPTECAEIEVPRDYSDPDGATISLTMSRVPATGERKGTIAGNPGGPGGDALGMFATSDAGTPEAEGRIVLPADVREHYDLLAVEPRGLARHLARASRHYAARRASLQQALARHLPDLDVVGIDAGLHVVLRLDDDVDDLAVADRAEALGVAVEPLSAYAVDDHRRGLVVGYARLPGGRADEVVRALARAVRG